jgi:hypothetical protein
VLSENERAILIALNLLIIERDVDFDHECGAVAVEVSDEAVDNLLPAKVQSTKLASAQRLPEQMLRAGWLAPELVRTQDLPLARLVSPHDLLRHQSLLL